jgi:Zinc finger C-x8-C-x5-C-x3-H type (and similar)
MIRQHGLGNATAVRIQLNKSIADLVQAQNLTQAGDLITKLKQLYDLMQTHYKAVIESVDQVKTARRQELIGIHAQPIHNECAPLPTDREKLDTLTEKLGMTLVNQILNQQLYDMDKQQGKTFDYIIGRLMMITDTAPTKDTWTATTPAMAYTASMSADLDVDIAHQQAAQRQENDQLRLDDTAIYALAAGGYPTYGTTHGGEHRQCYAFQRGDCTRGAQCRFMHGAAGGGGSTEISKSTTSGLPPLTTPQQPMRSTSTRQCIFFQQGTCADGDKCRFQHGMAVHGSGGTPTANPVPPLSAAMVSRFGPTGNK